VDSRREISATRKFSSEQQLIGEKVSLTYNRQLRSPVIGFTRHVTNPQIEPRRGDGEREQRGEALHDGQLYERSTIGVYRTRASRRYRRVTLRAEFAP